MELWIAPLLLLSFMIDFSIFNGKIRLPSHVLLLCRKILYISDVLLTETQMLKTKIIYSYSFINIKFESAR